MASLAGVVLPHEIWLKIFQHLTTCDIINLCNVSESHRYFLREKDIARYFDIGGDFSWYNVNVYTYIMENVGYQYIQHLNINNLYWIPLQDLRNFLKYLPNLQELLALDTRLGLRLKDVKLYGKLKTLALTLVHKEFDAEPVYYRNNMFMLKKLCVNIALKQDYFASLYKFFNELVGLEELWISDTDDDIVEPIKYDYIVFKLKFLKKLVIKSKVNIPFLDYKPFGLAKYFETRRFKSIDMCYERYALDSIVPYRSISLFEPFETEVEAAWDTIQKFHCEMPYGPKSAKEFYMTKQIKNIEFEELNFFHSRCFCNPTFIKATFDFLKATASRNLKKLSVKSCILQRTPRPKTQKVANLQEKKYPILDVIENCKGLKTLELMSCSNHECETNNNEDATCNITILDAYPFISNWMELERLTVEVPVHLDGKFLKDVLMLCLKLKFLRVISYSTNESLNTNLCQALPYGNGLEDFCFENKHINVQTIFLSLNRITNCKLRRIFLNATYHDSGSLMPLKEFLRRNDQLIFLYFSIVNQNSNGIQELLNVYKKNNKAKVFFIRKSVRHYVGTFPVPYVHRELMSYDTEVSTVDLNTFR